MDRREFEAIYEAALDLARSVAQARLVAHIWVAGGDRDETLEDLAQSIVGTESVVRLIMSVPFDAETYMPVLVEAADEVGRAFFPDVQKRFLSSLDEVPERALVHVAPTEETASADAFPQCAESLPDDLRQYLERLADRTGVEHLTSRLWSETNTQMLASRLGRLRRHYPDGAVRLDRLDYAERDLSVEEITTCARQVAAGIEVAFPWGFFARQTAERTAHAVRYLVDHELRRSPDELLKEGVLPFVALGLGPALRRCGGSVNRLLALAFPERVKPWMDSHVPPGYWDDAANRMEAVRWLVETHLGVERRAIPNAVHDGRITKREFSDAGLTWLIKNVYGWSVADALHEAYPGLHPWERYRRVQATLWEGDDGRPNATEALRWAFERANIAPDDLRTQMAAQMIRSALRAWHLTAAFSKGFGGDAVAALDGVFPGTFHPWEITRVPREAWNDAALRAKAVGWLLDKLGVLPDEIPHALVGGRLTPDAFKENGLDGVLRVTGSVWRTISDVFPGRFARWELGAVPKSYWRTRVHVRQAANWTLERLGIPKGAASSAIRDRSLTPNDFVRLGLGSLAVGLFRGDLVTLCQVADLLPSEQRVPLSRHYRRFSARWSGEALAWRLHGEHRHAARFDTEEGSELERHLIASRSIRRKRRQRRDAE